MNITMFGRAVSASFAAEYESSRKKAAMAVQRMRTIQLRFARLRFTRTVSSISLRCGRAEYPSGRGLKGNWEPDAHFRGAAVGPEAVRNQLDIYRGGTLWIKVAIQGVCPIAGIARLGFSFQDCNSTQESL